LPQRNFDPGPARKGSIKRRPLAAGSFPGYFLARFLHRFLRGGFIGQRTHETIVSASHSSRRKPVLQVRRRRDYGGTTTAARTAAAPHIAPSPNPSYSAR